MVRFQPRYYGISIQITIFPKENEMPIQRSLIQMELIGFPVNYDELRKTTDSISTLMQTLQKRIYQLHGKRFNIASPSEVAKVLFESSICLKQKHF